MTKEQLLRYWKRTGLVKDKAVLAAFKKNPRELFVPENLKEEAYGDYPLPIPGEQTISQPSTIMIMLQALELKETDKVLEIGTGSGYNAALIATITKKGQVYTTEIVPELVDYANERIKKLKLKNIKVIKSDGSLGYKKEAPYDRIIATAACPSIPKHWIDQLKEGGIIVAPVGPWHSQKMIKLRKAKGKLVEENLGDFMFVPLKGEYGY
jgi:protein-L-isoaspartate(D-aspartate) O-methyltransferase